MLKEFWAEHKPFWLMYPPKKYYKFRRQTLVNWLDRHSHICTQEFVSVEDMVCHYCNRGGDELWWWLPTCRAHDWHIMNFMSYGRHGDNPYRRK